MKNLYPDGGMLCARGLHEVSLLHFPLMIKIDIATRSSIEFDVEIFRSLESSSKLIWVRFNNRVYYTGLNCTDVNELPCNI